MAFTSMTGFAEAHGSLEFLRWRWEVKSVNGRGLDLRLRMPPGYDSIELPARKLAGERFKRGNLQAILSAEVQDGARSLRVDTEALTTAIKIAQSISAETGLPPARVDGLLALKGVIVQDETLAVETPERAARDAAILESLAVAFDALQRARTDEGAKLAALLKALVDEIEGQIELAQELAAVQPETLRDRLLAQLHDLLQPGAVSEDRLAQEVALLAVRADVREELDRLRAHVHEARVLIGSGGAIGRKLDFLAQEFNREANTLCSKSSDIKLTRTGLALKASIDQLREQAQNVE